MVNPEASIRYSNVISRRYVVHYKKMGEAIDDFISDLEKIKVNFVGALFYSLNNVPRDEILNIDLFMPVLEDNPDIMDDMYFYSYYSVERMISINIFKNFENDAQAAYAVLFEYMEENNLKQVTPIFHVFLGDSNNRFVSIRIGVIDEKSLK